MAETITSLIATLCLSCFLNHLLHLSIVLDYYGVYATFNVADISPYFGDEEDFRLEDESSPTRGE
ncbi:transmembrane protein, putative [Medicago truncatula]|uniref:Transmembrane protein, putative n=1 Tax=Medicago truncatula TaxID=3880 RepID=G7KYX0_MEDTR|nr:transmembrane protein, putative [Medicago truncatula]